MGLMKKKQPAKEEPVTQQATQEATENPITKAPEEMTAAERRRKLLVTAFMEEYEGIVEQGNETLRDNLLFAIYGELYALVEAQNETNELLRELNKKVDEANQ